jgi:uncharacterized protein (DUF1778 family)
MRDIAINLRAQAFQRDLIDRAANQLGRNRSDFLLEAACEKAQNVLLDQTFFTLDEKAFTRFAALCDAPAKPNPALTRLLASVSPWEEPIKAATKVPTKSAANRLPTAKPSSPPRTTRRTPTARVAATA